MSITLNHVLKPIEHWLDDSSVEEIAINKPGEAWIFKNGLFTCHKVADLSATLIENIAIVAAAQREQDVGFGKPLLSTDIDGRGRLQVVLEPITAKGYPSLTVRRGSDHWPTLQELVDAGYFRRTRSERPFRPANDDKLMYLYRNGKWSEFLCEAVAQKKNIIGCGITASGKTHFSKAMIGLIPMDVRLITVEDAPELKGIPHPNRVQMYYDKSSSIITASHLIEAALRMRIGRLFLQEIRDPQAAVAFLTTLQTGHSGGITTIHANHCLDVFTRLKYLIKQTAGGGAIEDGELQDQLEQLVDVVVHSTREEGPFESDEIRYMPAVRADAARKQTRKPFRRVA